MALIRQSMLAATSAIVLTISRFALMAILSRRLSLDAFGQVAFAQWLVDIVFLFCSFGATAVASRYFAEFGNRPEALRALVSRWRPFALGLPALAGAATAIGNVSLRPQAAATEHLFLAAWAAASGLWAMRTASLMGMQRFDLVLYGNGIAGAAMLAGALLLPSPLLGTAGAFAVLAIANMAGLAVSARAFFPAVSAERGEAVEIDWRSIARYAMNMWFTSMLWSLVWSRGEWPYVKALLGDAGVAQYAAATALFGGAVQGVMLSVAGIAPHLTRLWGEQRIDEALRTARRVMDMQLVLATGAAAVLIVLGAGMLRLGFGSAFGGGTQALAMLALGLPALAWSSHNFLLQLRTDARFNRDSTLLGLAVLYLLSAWLVPASGIAGAALSRAATMLLMGAMSLAISVRVWGMRAIPWRNLGIVVLLLGTLETALWFWPEAPWAARVAALVAAVVILVIGVRDDDGRGPLAWALQVIGRLGLSARIHADKGASA
ncbi:MAG TPA: lipopolysaccharide biosynthesis protein [Rudaea sp.]|nr:lipopolysaccharide biosynthesis protein [Rudaea sp.]